MRTPLVRRCCCVGLVACVFIACGASQAASPSVGIWCDTVPETPGASDPAYLMSLLEQQGVDACLLNSSELSDGARLDAGNLDLLVLPYGAYYPASASDALRGYLEGGGNLVTLGGVCFAKPLYRRDGIWKPRSGIESSAKPPVELLEMSEERMGALAGRAPDGDPLLQLSLSERSSGGKAARLAMHDLQTYKYIHIPLTGAPGYDVFHFSARGDANTEHLCIELNETDRSRWKAVVPLSTEWQSYTLFLDEFASYASEGRGEEGDFFHVERAANLSFGFPSILVGAGDHAFELADVELWASGVSSEDRETVRLRFTTPSHLLRAFGSQLKMPSRVGKVTVYHESAAFQGIKELHATPGSTMFPEVLRFDGGLSGRFATMPTDNALFLDPDPAGRGRWLLPTERWARAVPLLLTPKGQPAASLFVHMGGPHASGVWACFGITNRDLFRKGDQKMADAFGRLVERMVAGAFLTRVETQFEVQDGRVRMHVISDLLNQAAGARALRITARLFTGGAVSHSLEKTTDVELAPGATTGCLVLDVDTRDFDWKDFRVECRLLENGHVLDRLETEANVRKTVVALCDRFVQEQDHRDGGKISGLGFVDNRGVRALLAAYDLFDRQAYLDAALAWGRATLAEQRPDGGYLMGYGYYKEGNECYVADGGEIACAIAQLATCAPESERPAYMDSLRAYMDYRDSFRCEGGGIGVGWCKRDYGVRPPKPLDKVTKVFAPEKNPYTIGCTLAAATMYAVLTEDPQHNKAAVRDAYWWMARCSSTVGGAYVESAVWANAFLKGDDINADTEAFLREKFIPHVLAAKHPWWTTGGGRNVQGIDGLAYFYECIEKDPRVLAALMRATYHICSPESLSGIPTLLDIEHPSNDDWRYLHYAAVSLPDLLEPEIVRKPFRKRP